MNSIKYDILTSVFRYSHDSLREQAIPHVGDLYWMTLNRLIWQRIYSNINGFALIIKSNI